MRAQIFALLNKEKASADLALKVLAQCQSHVRNRIVIEGIGKECGVTLSGFRTGEHLELYYDMKRSLMMLDVFLKDGMSQAFESATS